MFLMWFDDDRKKSASQKIADALAAYERRTGGRANVVLVNAMEVGEAPRPVKVRPEPYIQPSNFYVGVEELAQ